MRYLAILAVSMFSMLLGMLFAGVAIQYGPGVSAIVPVSLVAILTGALGGTTAIVIRDQEKRLRAIEQRGQQVDRA